MATGARDRIVTATIALVRERGVHGTGVAEVLERSGAARGSIYQHFPAGKPALVAEAVRVAGQHLERLMTDGAAAAPEQPAIAMLEALLDWWEREIRRHGGALGCPIAAAAVDDDPVVNAAAQAVFERLHALLSETTGDPSGASVALSAVEGAILRSRVARDPEPLDDVRRHLTGLLGASPRT